MPRQQPTLSWHHIRDFTEKFQWTDPRSGLTTEGYNPPKDIKSERVPYTIRYITGKGEVEQGRCITLKVDRRRHQRMVQHINSGEIRIIRDYLVLEINGTKFVTRSISM